MSADTPKPRRRIPLPIVWGLLCIAVIAVLAGVFHWSRQDGKADDSGDDEAAQGKPVEGEPDTIELTADVVGRLGIKTEPVRVGPLVDALKLDGSLFIDPSRMARIHARFSGEIVEIAKHPGRPYAPGHGEEKPTPIGLGDKVAKGDLLAVLWSSDLGEKKSEFVNAYLQTALDRVTFERLEGLFKTGATSDRTVREAKRTLESNIIAQEKAERTLRAWRLTDDEIEALRAEAETIRRSEHRDRAAEKNWSRVEIRSPLEGRIVEMNVSQGEVVTDNTLDLFKVCDVSQLRVMCNVYEEDLPRLLAVKPADRYWKVWITADREGRPLRAPGGGAAMFDRIGQTIDPNQHTAVVMGWVSNADEQLRIGQFVTATIEFPVHSGEVAIPATATIIDDTGATLFVESKSSTAAAPRYTRRRVALVRQGKDIVRIKMQPDEKERAAGLGPLADGERLVIGGVLNLDSALDTLQSAATEKK